MKKYIAELIGTYAMVFCGTGAIVINQHTGGGVTHVGIAMTFGLIVMAMIYAFGKISGAHINPAVTIGFAIAKRFPLEEIPPYIIAQISGALLASLSVKFLFPENVTLGMTSPSGSELQSFVLETILMFFLMIVILNVADGYKETAVISGIAIGGTVMLEAMFAGPVTGASMNPARSLGPAVIAGNYDHLWIYITAPVLGSSLAVWLKKLLQ